MSFLDENGVKYLVYKFKSKLASVAISGSYSDLSNTPTILTTSDVNTLIETALADYENGNTSTY